MTKREIRDAMRQRREALDAAARAEASDAVCRVLAALPALARAREIACYLSLPRELSLEGFIAACRMRGAGVCVPAWDAVGRAYRFVRWTPGAPLVTGRFQVPEPADPCPVPPRTVEAVVMPGMAFDRRGGRLGYGGGFYDRLLAACAPDVLKVGVGFAWQVVDDDLPLEAHDVRVDLVATDRGVVDCHCLPAGQNL